MQQLLLLSLLIFKQLAVNYADYPACTFGNVQVVSYHDYGMTLLVKLAEKLQNFLACGAVKSACGLIGEEQLWVAHQRPIATRCC